MRIDSFNLLSGGVASNFAIASGSAFPTDTNTVGELFYKTSGGTVGLHIFDGADWVAVTADAIAAAASAAAAAASYDSFDDRYLGAKSSDPTLDNDSDALITGALYWNTTSDVMRVYDGAAWTDVAPGVSAPYQTLSGTGSQTAFTLNSEPGSLGSLEVFVSGVRQTPGTHYTLSGSTLTFVTAPPAASSIFARWITTEAINVPADQSVTTAKLSSDFGQLGMRNKIINGKMEISQRGNPFTSPSSGAYTLDRYVWANTTAGAVTVSTQADSPDHEFPLSLRVAVTTADSSVAAGDVAYISQIIEGYNVRDLIAKTFTLSFWVRSSKVGLHSVSFGNAGGDRTWVSNYTVNVANTWEKKIITVSGGLTAAGTWNWTSGAGLYVTWPLVVGTTRQTTAGAWQTGNFSGTSGQVNCLDTIGNIFSLTGIQLEAGGNATQFEHRPYGMELALCQRYFYAYESGSNGQGDFGTGLCRSTTSFLFSVKYAVPMRATPTFGYTTIPAEYAVANHLGAIAVTTIQVQASGPQSSMCEFLVASGLTAGGAARAYAAGGTRYLTFSAEL